MHTIYKHFIDEFQTSIKVNFKAILTFDIVVINMPLQQHRIQQRIQKQKAKHTFSEPLKKMKEMKLLAIQSILKAYFKGREKERVRKLFKKEKEGFFL